MEALRRWGSGQSPEILEKRRGRKLSSGCSRRSRTAVLATGPWRAYNLAAGEPSCWRDGTPCVSGTRIPALTVLAYLQDGDEDRAIRDDYLTLPLYGVEAVFRWASEHGLELGRRA